jgi:hypothetical protein
MTKIHAIIQCNTEQLMNYKTHTHTQSKIETKFTRLREVDQRKRTRRECRQ